MKTLLMFIFCICSTFMVAGQSLENGKSIFDSNCKICHSIGKGKMIGPDLSDIHEKREKDWLFQFITNSAALIESGDEMAVALYEEYDQLDMPAHDLSDTELEDLLAYIIEMSQVEEVVVTPVETLGNESSVAHSFPLWFIISGSVIVVTIVILLFIILYILKMYKKLDHIKNQ